MNALHFIRGAFRSGRYSLLLGAIICTVIYAEQPSTSEQTPELQARVLARVFQDALGNEAMASLSIVGVPISAFHQPVSAEYIPTVGVIVKINISFPISPSEQPPVSDDSPEKADLWEKHLREWGEGDLMFSIVEEALPMHLKVQKGERDDMNVRVRELRGFPPSETWANAPVYDEKRVEHLRGEVLDTIAKYGVRLTAVPETERVLIIVQAPRAGAQVRDTRVERRIYEKEGDGTFDEKRREDSAFGGGGGIGVGQFGGGGGAVGGEIAGGGGLGGGQGFGGGVSGGPGTIDDRLVGETHTFGALFRGLEMGRTEKWLFSIPRSALLAESTRDALAPSVTEHRY